MSKQVTRSASIQLNAPPDETFPLFTPAGEKLWVHGWEPEYVYPESGEAMPGNVWKTQHPNQEETIWVTVDYDPKTCQASYINVTPKLRTTRVDVSCTLEEEGHTTAHICYTLTALSKEGQQVVNDFTEDHFKHWMQAWQDALNHYLAHGKALSHN